MVKYYEDNFNFLELFIISFKIMGILYYKRYGVYEWKLCEVFYKYLLEIICYGFLLNLFVFVNILGKDMLMNKWWIFFIRFYNEVMLILFFWYVL